MNLPYRIGLTGGIGMGKSTTAKMFADEGVAVWDADAAVHRFYRKGGSAIKAIALLKTDAVKDGTVSREALREWIKKDPTALKKIENIVHPLAKKDREVFLQKTSSTIVLFDIPLLFETKADQEMDLTLVVSCKAEEQRQRVLKRGTMDEVDFERIQSAQMPNEEKRARADRIIETDTLEHARAQVREIVNEIREQQDA